MKKSTVLLLFLPLLFPAAALAQQTITLNWEAPTTRTDGTALTVSEIKQYNLYRCGAVDAFATTDPSITAYTETLIDAPSDYCYQHSTVDEAGTESALSNMSSVPSAPPSATNLTITITTVTVSASDGSL